MHLSIIVPVYNSRQQLSACLAALVASHDTEVEIIVVDDASTDDSAMVAAQFPGVQVYRLAQNGGPAAARNYGAQRARGEILFFVDADVVVAADAVRRVRKVFGTQPDLAAVFGSYDDRPSAPGVVSQYRNLLHHFVHQQGNPEASTFWAGCGAIRRAVFTALGGFDAERFPRPAIEDIELGYRLRQAGYRILLDKTLQATHLKHWTLCSMIRTDLLARAIPWARLLLSNGKMPNDLNVTRSQRVSVALVGTACMFLLLVARWPVLFLPAAIALGGVVGLNWRLFAFFARRRGLVFAGLCVPLHLLHYCCSGLGYLWSWGMFQATRVRSFCSKRARLQAGAGGPA